MAEDKIEKVYVDGLGRVEINMDDGAGRGGSGSAEVYRLDEEDWMEAEPYVDGDGGAWESGGAGADGADQAVEQYWETPGNSASDTTDFAQEVELARARAEDEEMWEALGVVSENEEPGQFRILAEELQRAKKRRTDKEPQSVSRLGRVRSSAAFDKKSGQK